MYNFALEFSSVNINSGDNVSHIEAKEWLSAPHNIMVKGLKRPEYIFESSWEVCNKVGGIYTVLSTRAKTLQETNKDKVIFIGPDCWGEKKCPYFKEDKKLLADWRKKADDEGLIVKVGRWTIPGEPIAVLVDFQPYFVKKNEIYGWLWENYQVDSLHAYGDYDEASMFSYAAALVVESFYNFCLDDDTECVYQANEWMTGLGALYINKKLPQIGTIFTTHATSIGRSIAGNNKPLYDYLFAYNGDQMAGELNMQSKHSIEKQTAMHVDCFTTVSDITARECKELMDKEVDVVLPNGFEDDFVPRGAAFTRKRNAARKRIFEVANALTGETFDKDTLVVSTSGRYEFRNKGVDVFIESMNRLLRDQRIADKKILAFIEVPGWVGEPRQDLQERLLQDTPYGQALPNPVITHNLHDWDGDNVLRTLRYGNLQNRPMDRVHVIFTSCYLDGQDGIFGLPYYDMLIGDDLAVYPSYYEPWGYTPLEAVAFHVPCVTTTLAGFGLWANKVKGGDSHLEDGVEVLSRNDYNFDEVADGICRSICQYASYDKKQQDAIRRKAARLSEKALWKHFITYYYDAYDVALRKAQERR